MNYNANAVVEYYRQLWHQIHSKASSISTPQQHRDYCIWIRNIGNNIECNICKTHMLQYLQTNPPENAQNLFIWAWDFHNDVNQRLGKPIVDYATAAIGYLGWST
jgi:hypothetical protein